MPVIEHSGIKINLDNDGYLLNSCTSKEYNFLPILRFVCKNVGQPRNCVTEKFIEPVIALKIAGLPNPGDEVNPFGKWEPLGF